MDNKRNLSKVGRKNNNGNSRNNRHTTYYSFIYKSQKSYLKNETKTIMLFVTHNNENLKWEGKGT